MLSKKPLPKFSLEGSPHRPLQLIQHNHSKHMLGQVASTGNSPLAKVLDGLSLFGGKGYGSPKAAHWKALSEHYYNERALIYWIETGKRLPRRTGSFQKGTTKNNQKREGQTKIPMADLLAIV